MWSLYFTIIYILIVQYKEPFSFRSLCFFLHVLFFFYHPFFHLIDFGNASRASLDSFSFNLSSYVIPHTPLWFANILLLHVCNVCDGWWLTPMRYFNGNSSDTMKNQTDHKMVCHHTARGRERGERVGQKRKPLKGNTANGMWWILVWHEAAYTLLTYLSNEWQSKEKQQIGEKNPSNEPKIWRVFHVYRQIDRIK